MARFVIMRHGDYVPIEGEWPLSDEGKKQMEICAAGLNKLKAKKPIIFTSSASRAADGAKIIAKSMQISKVRELDELRNGHASGRNDDKSLEMIFSARDKGHDLIIIITHMDVVPVLAKKISGEYLGLVGTGQRWLISNGEYLRFPHS